MRWITASLLLALCTASLAACTSPPPKPVVTNGYLIADPHYWDKMEVSRNKAVRTSYLAGQDGMKMYRSVMAMACAQRHGIVDPQQRLEADADCTAFAAMPVSTP
jgi:hypothetical protein